MGLFVLDHVYSLLVCETASILSWQAFWNCWYAFIDFEKGPHVLIFFTGLGMGMLLFLCAFQIPVAKLSVWLGRHLHWISSLLLEDLYFFLILAGQMAYWIGVWELLIIYIFPDNELYSCLVTMFGSYVLMAIFGITSVVANAAIAVDQDTQDGQGAMWETHYFLTFLNTSETDHSAIITDTTESQPDGKYKTPCGVDNLAVELGVVADCEVPSTSLKF